MPETFPTLSFLAYLRSEDQTVLYSSLCSYIQFILCFTWKYTFLAVADPLISLAQQNIFLLLIQTAGQRFTWQLSMSIIQIQPSLKIGPFTSSDGISTYNNMMDARRCPEVLTES